jgi:hypothetical protein
LDNTKDSFYIQFNLDGLVKVSEDVRVETLEKISSLISELLKIDGVVSSKGNVNIISELEVVASMFNDDLLN